MLLSVNSCNLRIHGFILDYLILMFLFCMIFHQVFPIKRFCAESACEWPKWWWLMQYLLFVLMSPHMILVIAKCWELCIALIAVERFNFLMYTLVNPHVTSFRKCLLTAMECTLNPLHFWIWMHFLDVEVEARESGETFVANLALFSLLPFRLLLRGYWDLQRLWQICLRHIRNIWL